MKMYQLHQIPTFCGMFRLQAFKQIVSKLIHDSGTKNTMQTDVTDCYYCDHDFILCAVTV